MWKFGAETMKLPKKRFILYVTVHHPLKTNSYETFRKNTGCVQPKRHSTDCVPDFLYTGCYHQHKIQCIKFSGAAE